MTLGDGIFYSTLLLIFAGATYQISIRHKWKLFAKIFGYVAFAVAVVGGGIWGWSVYEDRLEPVTEYLSLRIGMTPVEVSLALGKPTFIPPETSVAGRGGPVWVYYTEDQFAGVKTVRFEGESESLRVKSVCSWGGGPYVLGFGKGDTEERLIARLGNPKSESVDNEGLRKILAYPHWGAAYEIEQGKVVRQCLALHEMRFAEAAGAMPSWMDDPILSD